MDLIIRTICNFKSKCFYFFVALARFAFGHNKHLKSVAASYWKSQPKSMLSSLTNTSSLNANPTGQTISAKSSQISSAIKVVDDSSVTACDVRVSSSSPLTSTGFMHGSPLSDHSDSGILCQENGNTGVIGYLSSKPLEPAVYSNCVLALYSMAKDPYPQIAKLGQRILSIIGIEQVVAKPSRLAGSLFRQGDSSGLSPSSTLAGLVRSTSWLDMSAGNMIVDNFKYFVSTFCIIYLPFSRSLVYIILSLKFANLLSSIKFPSFFFFEFSRSTAIVIQNSSREPPAAKDDLWVAESLFFRIQTTSAEFPRLRIS